MSVWEELYWGCNQAFRTIIPEPQNRIPVTLSRAPFLAACLVPFFFMGYLARREDTYLIRLLLLPTAITGALAFGFTHYYTIPQLNVYNWGLALFAEVIIAKALEYGLTPEGALKVGEVRPGVSKGKETTNGTANGYANGHHPTSQPSPFPKWLSDSVRLMISLRGLGWKHGEGVHTPREWRPLDRPSFLWATRFSFVKNFLILDFLETIIKIFPGIGDPHGGTMFYPDLPPLQRYIVSTIVHLITGFALLAGFGMVYDLVTLVAVGLLGDETTNWPPILDKPWKAQSLHELWSKRWHQLLRRTFIVYGGIPGKWIAGNLGMTLGVFIASGLYHELSTYTMAHGFNLHPIIFFGMQGPLLILERICRRTTGRRVGGWPGTLWVMFIMFVCAQPMIDSWHRRGLGGGLVIPPFISPARHILPLLLPPTETSV